MDKTYIRVEVRGTLNDNEIKGLQKFLQDAADQLVLAVVTDFGSNDDKSVLEEIYYE